MATKNLKSNFRVGVEKKIVYLTAEKPKAVSQADVNTVGFFTAAKDVQEQVITNFSDLTGLVESDLLHKKIKAAFGAGVQKVLVKGKNQSSGTKNYGDIFNETQNEWFGTITDETTIEEITKVSKEVSARRKMYCFQLAKGTTVDDSLATSLNAITDETTAGVVSFNAETADAEIFGYAIAKAPGSTLIRNKFINGGVDGGLTGAEQGIADKANINYFAKMKGQLGLANGKTITGDPVDFIHCSMAYQFRLEEEITAWLKNTPKPSFDDLGTLKAVIDRVTAQFERVGALSPGKTIVSFPPLEELPKNDILNGILTGVEIETYYRYGIGEIVGRIIFAV